MDQQQQQHLNIFESPDMTNFRPSEFLYHFNSRTKKASVTTFDPSKVIFNPVEQRTIGNVRSNIVRLTYPNPLTGESQRIILQAPSLFSKFGLASNSKSDDNSASSNNNNNNNNGGGGGGGGGASEPVLISNNKSGYKIDLGFKDMMSLAYGRDGASREVLEVEAFFKTLYKLDQVTLDKAKENCKSWFPGNRDIARDPKLVLPGYKALTALRFSDARNTYYPPSLRVKAPMRGDKFDFMVFDANREPIAPNCIVPNSYLRCLIEVTSIWFVNGSYGIGMRAAQVQVRSTDVMDCFCFAEEAEAKRDVPVEDDEYLRAAV